MIIPPLRPSAVAAELDRTLAQRYDWRPSFGQVFVPALLYAALIALFTPLTVFIDEVPIDLFGAAVIGVGLYVGSVLFVVVMLLTILPFVMWVFFALFGGSGSFLATAYVIVRVGFWYLFLNYAVLLINLAVTYYFTDVRIAALTGHPALTAVGIGGLVLIVLGFVVGLCSYATLIFALAATHGFVRPYFTLIVSVPILFVAVAFSIVGLALLIGGGGFVLYQLGALF